jgi:uncharacterized protein (TIGR02118 family)
VIKFVAFLKKGPGMSDEDLKKWWLGGHAKLTREKFPGLKKYVICLAVGPENRVADGMAEMWFENLDTLKKGLQSDIMKQLVADCGNYKISLALELWNDEFEQTPLPGAKEPTPDMVKFISVLKRPANMTVAECKKWWLGGHADYTKKNCKGLRKYIVNLAIGPRGEQAKWSNKGVETEGDGIAEMWFDDVPAIKSFLQSDTLKHLVNDAVTDHHMSEVAQLWVKDYPQKLTTK